MVLDAASLEAITQEIRTCFLYEDAPDQLSVLDAGIRKFCYSDETSDQVDYPTLMRAAHSLKGGAGIAQFLTLRSLAHQLEELLQALQQKQVQNQKSAFELLSVSVEQINTFIAAATSTAATNEAAPETILVPILTEIENFFQQQGEQGERGRVVGAHICAPVQESGRGGEGEKETIGNSSDSSERGLRSLNLRMPVSRLERIDNTIGELFISYERLSVYQEQLAQVDRILKRRADRLNPLSEQVQAIYDNLVISPAPISESNKLLESTAEATKIHNTLQDLQELIVQVHEARADVDLLNGEFREALAQLRYQLDDLRSDVTEARLVRFDTLAEQCLAAQQTFSQRYNKTIELVIVGQETLIDQVILSQLKIPLLHLFRNAFVHGIETPEERIAQGKAPTAQITLSAAIVGNQIIVSHSDDGRGIDIAAVRQKAIELGMCDRTQPALTREILEFLFQPGFSTASEVTYAAGRGMGLDIVRGQVERLRGKVEVETKQGQGTTFRISIPLTLNILPLLLCKCQQQTLAIPAVKVQQLIALSSYSEVLSHSSRISLGDRSSQVYSLIHLLPYVQPRIIPPLVQLNQHLGVVLEIDDRVIVLAVNSVLGERELVLKPFDSTIKVPAYILGGAVLGTGEVVPVLSPEHLGELIAQANRGSVQHKSNTDLLLDQGKAKILIVDDAIAFRRILERILTRVGYEVIQCTNGQEALEKLNSPHQRFDLVISDLEMPRMDGFELLKQIRIHSVWHSLPVLVLTSRENQWYRQTATDLGATEYFTKPFRTDELLEVIAQLLPAIAIKSYS